MNKEMEIQLKQCFELMVAYRSVQPGKEEKEIEALKEWNSRKG